jgi:hypothetical protein
MAKLKGILKLRMLYVFDLDKSGKFLAKYAKVAKKKIITLRSTRALREISLF